MTPRIIRTREELADLDPDTLVAMNPITKGHATAYVWSADTALRVNLLWHAPLVTIATGEQVRTIAGNRYVTESGLQRLGLAPQPLRTLRLPARKYDATDAKGSGTPSKTRLN